MDAKLAANVTARPKKNAPGVYALAVGSSILVLVFTFGLRLWSLEGPPMHADEATGARILADRLDGGGYRFDPVHFHGPLLTGATAPFARAAGADGWADLTAGMVRGPTAWAGVLAAILAGLVPLAAFFRRNGGDGRERSSYRLFGGIFFTVAFAGTSPFLVYYSRRFIHEPWLVLFGVLALAALVALLRRPEWRFGLVAGVCIGLMAATRETFVIPLAAWFGAGALFFARERYARSGEPQESPPGHLRAWVRPMAALALGALAVTALAYTNLGQDPGGLGRFVQTYFVYETTPGHEKPWFYFGWLLLWPKEAAGQWWSEGGIFLLALSIYAVGRGRQRRLECFVVEAGLLQLLAFSLIPYKTPWLVSLAWAHLCIGAGLAASGWLGRRRRWPRAVVATLLLALLVGQAWQSVQAAFRLPSDARNPYAYVPTSPDLERAADWLEDLARTLPEVRESIPVVVGRDYWPLPWYLRDFPTVGYFDALPPDASQRPLLLLVRTPGGPDPLVLEATHQTLPRGLRHEVPLAVCIRRDLWTRYLSDD